MTANNHFRCSFTRRFALQVFIECCVSSQCSCSVFQICIMDSCVQALDTFNTAVVSWIYYAMFTSHTILSAIMFKVHKTVLPLCRVMLRWFRSPLKHFCCFRTGPVRVLATLSLFSVDLLLCFLVEECPESFHVQVRPPSTVARHIIHLKSSHSNAVDCSLIVWT